MPQSQSAGKRSRRDFYCFVVEFPVRKPPTVRNNRCLTLQVSALSLRARVNILHKEAI